RSSGSAPPSFAIPQDAEGSSATVPWVRRPAGAGRQTRCGRGLRRSPWPYPRGPGNRTISRLCAVLLLPRRLALQCRDTGLQGLDPRQMLVPGERQQLADRVAQLRAGALELAPPLLSYLLSHRLGVGSAHLSLLDEFLQAGLDLLLRHDCGAHSREYCLFD